MGTESATAKNFTTKQKKGSHMLWSLQGVYL